MDCMSLALDVEATTELFLIPCTHRHYGIRMEEVTVVSTGNSKLLVNEADGVNDVTTTQRITATHHKGTEPAAAEGVSKVV